MRYLLPFRYWNQVIKMDAYCEPLSISSRMSSTKEQTLSNVINLILLSYIFIDCWDYANDSKNIEINFRSEKDTVDDVDQDEKGKSEY